jgi:hypothetical protein
MISSAPAVVLQVSLRFLRDNVYWLVKQLPPERERAMLSMLYGVGGETVGNGAHENHENPYYHHLLTRNGQSD